MEGRRRRKYGLRRNNSEKEKEKPSWSMSVLPHDLVGVILLRLVTKKILQCRCVCKTWSDLLLDKESNILRSITARDTLVLQSSSTGVYLVDLERGREEVMKLNIPKGKLELVGSCNGFLCLFNKESKKSFYVCNPMTNEYIQTPPKPKKKGKKRIGKVINAVHGFGFSPMTNQYKVIRVIEKRVTHPHVHNESEGEIFTLGTNNWRSIGDTPFPSEKDYFGVPLNGVIHWIANEFMCALDIDSEKIRPISLPPHFDQRDPKGIMLGVLRECLYICEDIYINIDDTENLEIWVMKNYGVEESWSKDIIITRGLLTQKGFCFVKPIMILKGGDVLLLHGDYDSRGVYLETLRLFNPIRKSFSSNIKIKGVPSILEAVTYVANFGSMRDIVNEECVRNLYI